MSMETGKRTLVPILIGAALAAIAWLAVPPAAVASRTQRAMFEEDVGMLQNPARTVQTLRQLGVLTIRLSIHWADVAPDTDSQTKPSGFDATNPNAYGNAWAPYDTAINDAQAAGIEVELALNGPAPDWAATPGAPPGATPGFWMPHASDYGQWVQAVATHYPGVHFWEIYNEPNWGQLLAPQANPGSSDLISPSIYRPMLDAAWSALQATGHGGDTIITGSLSPRGHDQPGYFLASEPLPFLRDLYCVDSNYHPLTGSAASTLGCPTTPDAGSFRAAHPALFSASGVGIHPYPYNTPPTQADGLANANTVEFNQLPSLEATADRLVGAYGSRVRFPIFNTEYSYETNPPNASSNFVSPDTAASYINWAEYLSWRDPRIVSFLQFLLHDPDPSQGVSIFGYGGFATGLVFYSGTPKADYYAYRMPVFLPVTSPHRLAVRATVRRHHRRVHVTRIVAPTVEVWGDVRPAHFAQADTGQTQHVSIQLNGRTLRRVNVTDVRGYFDVHVQLPTSGWVRLAWSYPANDPNLLGGFTAPVAPGQTIYSRSVYVRVLPPLPVLSGLRISPRIFAIAGRHTRPIKVRVNYKLSMAARVTFIVERPGTGRVVKGRCVAPRRANRHDPACTRLITVGGRFGRRSTSGANSFLFNGRIGGRSLPPGSYQLIATPTAGGQTGAPKSAAFRIVR